MNYFEAIDLLDKVKHGYPASIRDINFALFLTGDIDEELKLPIGCSGDGSKRETEEGDSPVVSPRNYPNANRRQGQSPQMAKWIFQLSKPVG